MTSALRDRWQIFDLGLSGDRGVDLRLSRWSTGRLTLSRNFAFSALVLSLAFILLPRIVFGSAYADMRLAPFLFAIALLAIRFKHDTHLADCAGAGVGRVGIRPGARCLDQPQPRHRRRRPERQACRARPCADRRTGDCVRRAALRPIWELPRNDHLGSMVIVRRLGFSNDQWPLAGSSLLTVRNTASGAFRLRSIAEGAPAEPALCRGLADRNVAAPLSARPVRLSVADRSA